MRIILLLITSVLFLISCDEPQQEEKEQNQSNNFSIESKRLKMLKNNLVGEWKLKKMRYAYIKKQDKYSTEYGTNYYLEYNKPEIIINFLDDYTVKLHGKVVGKWSYKNNCLFLSPLGNGADFPCDFNKNYNVSIMKNVLKLSFNPYLSYKCDKKLTEYILIRIGNSEVDSGSI